MEQELMKKVIELLPKIKANNEVFTEQELVVVKAAFEDITGIKVGLNGMNNCGGKLCEDFKRSIVNYMNSYKHVKTEAPKKTKVEKKKMVELDPEDLNVKAGEERNTLMAKCLEIAEEKEIKKPHHRAGVDSLTKYIETNG